MNEEDIENKVKFHDAKVARKVNFTENCIECNDYVVNTMKELEHLDPDNKVI